MNLQLDLLPRVILPVVVVVKHGTRHHVNAVVNSGVLLQQGAVEVVPDPCRAGPESTRKLVSTDSPPKHGCCQNSAPEVREDRMAEPRTYS